MRLIDADALVKDLAYCPPELLADEDYLYAKIGKQPTIEAESVRQWISVKDRLPAKIGDACWVWGKGMLQPETDSWMGNRGDKGAYLYLAQPRFFSKSGWYFNEAFNITHWMPIERPEPPEEEDDDRLD